MKVFAVTRKQAVMFHPPMKSAARQWAEKAELKLRRGIGPRYYDVAALGRTGTSRSDILGHINDREYKALVDRLNPPDAQQALFDKRYQKECVLAAGLPTARTLYAFAPGEGRPAALAAAIESADMSAIAVKPLAGFGGRGFRAFDVRGCELLDRLSGNAATPDELTSLYDESGAIVEPYLSQHEWYAALNPTSLNTWRIWAIAGVPGEDIVLAYLRMGRAGMIVDNRTSGGVVSALGSDGRMGPVQEGSAAARLWRAHPDSGVTIINEVPPLIEEAKALAWRTLAAMPELRFGGIDVAITTEGPAVVEVNPRPDRMGAARCGIPLKRWIDMRGL